MHLLRILSEKEETVSFLSPVRSLLAATMNTLLLLESLKQQLHCKVASRSVWPNSAINLTLKSSAIVLKSSALQIPFLWELIPVAIITCLVY